MIQSFTSCLLLTISPADLRTAGIYVICLILAISVHEFSHAFVADRLGDPTPSRQGRLTLNPIAHADPIGTLLLPIVLALTSVGMIFGWGRPVQTQPRLYKRNISMRAGMAIVAFAGPLSNLILAGLTIFVLWGLTFAGVWKPAEILYAATNPLILFFYLNLALFAFNLIPLHPLDGGKILSYFLGVKRQHIDHFLERYGGFILLAIVFMFPDLLRLLFRPVYSAGSWVLMTALT